MKPSIAALFGLILATPVFADQDPAIQIDPEVILKDVVTERDVSVFFDYLRATVFAASQGFEAPPPPPELKQRAEAIGNALKARGALTALLFINALERSAREAFRDAPAPRRLPPPSVPYTKVND